LATTKLINITKRLNKRKIKHEHSEPYVFFGVDPSVSNTAICAVAIYKKNRVMVAYKEFAYKSEFGKKAAYTTESVNRVVRARHMGKLIVGFMDNIRRRITDGLYDGEMASVMVTLEGYSFGSRGKVAHLGEYGGILRLCIMQWLNKMRCNTTTAEIAPTSIKKMIYGNGRADKKIMAPAVFKALVGVGVNDDVGDAFAAAIYPIVNMKYWKGYHEWLDKHTSKGSLV